MGDRWVSPGFPEHPGPATLTLCVRQKCTQDTEAQVEGDLKAEMETGTLSFGTLSPHAVLSQMVPGRRQLGTVCMEPDASQRRT